MHTNSAGNHYLYGVRAEAGGSFFLVGRAVAAGHWDRLYIVQLTEFEPALLPGAATLKLNPGIPSGPAPQLATASCRPRGGDSQPACD